MEEPVQDQEPTRSDKNFYLDLLEGVHSHVVVHYRKLFNEAELALLDAFSNAPEGSKRLYARLFQRKRGFIRVNSLSYPEIPNPAQAVSDLARIGFASTELVDLEEALKLLDTSELKRISVGKTGKKGDAVESILRESKKQKSLWGGNTVSTKVKQVSKLLGPVVKIDCLELVRRTHTAYFCFTSCQESTIKDALLSFIGVKRYHQALDLENSVHQALANKDWDKVVNIKREILQDWVFQVTLFISRSESPSWSKSLFTHLRIWTRILSACRHALGRLKLYTEEEEMLEMLLGQLEFCREKRGSWFERRCLLAERYLGLERDKQERKLAAQKLCLEALKDKTVLGGAASAINERYQRLVSSKSGDEPETDFDSLDRGMAKEIRDIPMEYIYRSKIRMENKGGAGGTKSAWRSEHTDEGGETGGGVSVEDISLQHYNELGWRGFHCEGSILSTLFGLLLHDVIYDNIRGVFKNAYQVVPLDYGTDQFYSNRLIAIEKRLDMIEKDFGKALELLKTHWYQNNGVQSLVNWNFELEDILCIANALGGERTSKICGIIARYVKRRSGLPDLVLFRDSERDDNVSKDQIKLVEVKGPGDTLKPHQIVWIQNLLEMGVDCAVLRVVDSNDKSSKISGKRKRSE